MTATKQKTIEAADTFTRRPRVALAGHFLAGYRHPQGPDLAGLDLTFAGRIANLLNSDAATLRNAPPDRIVEVYQRMRRSRLAYGTGWAIEGLDGAEGEAVYAALDAHYQRGVDLAAAERGA